MTTMTLAMLLPVSPIKWAGLAIPDPTTSAQRNFEAIILLCSHILAAFQGVDVFQSKDHIEVIREVKAELKLRYAAKSESSLDNLASKMENFKRQGDWPAAAGLTIDYQRHGTLCSIIP
jgi:hypothetical protein